MGSRKKVLLKITGEIFLAADKHSIDTAQVKTVAQQIQALSATHLFAIVIGGGNFFRGDRLSSSLGISPAIGHQIGMLATMMNGLFIKDILEQEAVPAAILNAIDCPTTGSTISHQAIVRAQEQNRVIVFTGGTGNPFFSTDTAAIVRALQINAVEVWKGSNIDGVYTKDPKKFPDAQRLSTVSFATALNEKLSIMDTTAFTLAQQHCLPIRIFNILSNDALLHAAGNEQFGSIIS